MGYGLFKQTQLKIKQLGFFIPQNTPCRVNHVSTDSKVASHTPSSSTHRKQENPNRGWGFQEPKTKIYETFYLQLFSQPQVLMIRTAAKIVFFSILNAILEKKSKIIVKKLDFYYICNLNNKKSTTMGKFMDKLVEAIIKNDGLSETEAKAKLNLIYIKMNQSEIKEFVDEYIDWLMKKKKLNYKAILQTPDQQVHDMYVSEFK